ncbi:Uncharacterized protein Adt_31744 [Abeliophyllum distichum]|uniref:Uncharacterized protein n=1 Tax=Abeliophyllum distichum TaxID=126358 RepID=A0ABD1RF46_9LAMI
MAGSLNFCSIHVSSILTKFSLRLHMIFPLLPSPPWHINDHSISLSSSFVAVLLLHVVRSCQPPAYPSSREQKYRVWQSVFLLLLMEAQVLRRLLETIYVFKYITTRNEAFTD